ncbi:MAG: SDR family NAD(P)-dependent oxidoreductase [Deltaproteobacteria bacterium]|jgi:short-subunit dehydrogenase|nr:SDR family NAD(P)-dependent oxidoreductase [Deltaproteobacteria bacterium]
MTTENYDAETFRTRFGTWALVAGASDGIGESFAHQIAERGLNVALLARRESLLDEVAAAIRERHGVETRVLVADLTGDDLDDRVARGTEDLEVGLLVYNAGAVHGAKHFHDQPVEHALGLVNLNCRGPVLLAHRFGLRMRERGRGGILLLTSIAALCGSSYTSSYCATKAFDLMLAESLWHELGPQGVDVMGVIAGATRTPSMLTSNSAFEAYPGIMDPEDVALGALANLGRGPVWVAGEANRENVKDMMPVSRTQLINGMAQATAQLYELPYIEMKGIDFGDLD